MSSKLAVVLITQGTRPMSVETTGSTNDIPTLAARSEMFTYLGTISLIVSFGIFLQ